MKLTSILCLCLFLCLQAFPQEYVMVWNDEFNTPGLPDSTKWNYEVGKVRNNELQYYTYQRLENARIQDTVLILEARKESYLEASYTSASITSRMKGDFLYGKFEISARVPVGAGTWPAIWMMPTDDAYGHWPRSGEIDIMEYVGYDPHKLYYNIHFEGKRKKGHDSKASASVFLQPYYRFVKFTLVWTPAKIEWFEDDKLVHTYKKKSDHPRLWPFNKRFYLILNLAFGGTWGGREGVDDTLFPHKFYVDYVRVYQLME